MKIGLLVCAYDCADTIKECLQPWVNLAKELDIDIAVVSTQFTGFPEKNNKPTHEAMSTLFYDQKACIVDYPFPISEHEARNMPLYYLQKQHCDVIWLLDGDEFYTEEEIRSIAKRVEKNPLVTWWSIPFKNYIFDGKQYVEGFCPPRIFRTQVGKHIMKEFYWDNDVKYVSIDGLTEVDYKNLSSQRIPTNIANIRHMTWLHTNGADKVKYQLEHFGHCSYQWNEEMKRLEINTDFHKQHGVPLPEILSD